jgi:hypothetical protein
MHVHNNYWDMATIKLDGRIDLQLLETNPNLRFNVSIAKNTFYKVASNIYSMCFIPIFI